VKVGDEVKVHQAIMILNVIDKKAVKPVVDSTAASAAEQDRQQVNKRSPAEDLKREDERKKAQLNMGNEQTLVSASPLARRIAREYNVDITGLGGTSPGQRITRQDVENYIIQTYRSTDGHDNGKQKPAVRENVTIEAMSKIRRLIAKNTQESWQTIPHVTQFDEADLTLIEEFRKENSEKIAKEGGKLTVTAILVKIVGFALQRFPLFNSSIDMQDMKVIYFNHYNIGIAVDTPKGLLIPVIKNVESKSLSEVAAELTDLSNKARDNKISIEELAGGTFTISNLGGIGGTGFTPIIYKPQVAILGVSRASMKQVYADNQFTARLILPLSLSYDHRLIDGADGARFLSWIKDAVEKPFGVIQ